MSRLVGQGTNLIAARKADIGDSEDIFEWRNEELTRQMSLNSGLVEWDGHSQWFSESFENKSRLLVICEDAECRRKVAIVRFDVELDRALVSINLAPDMRGKGLAKLCLSSAIAYFQTLFANVSIIEAQIKSVNAPSKRSFEGVGFEFVKESGEVLYYEYIV